MKKRHSLRYDKAPMMLESMFVALALLLTACGGAISNTTGSATPAPIRVNGFGPPQIIPMPS